MLCLPCDFSNDAKVKEQLLYRLRNFFYVSDQRPDLVIQDLQNFFVEKSSYSRPVNVVFWWSGNPRPELPIKTFALFYAYLF